MSARVPIRRKITAAVTTLSLAGACGLDDTDKRGARNTVAVAGAVVSAPRDMATPNEQMQAVLNQLQAIAGLPPITIINAQIDPLRAEGEMLAADAITKRARR